MRLLVDTHIYYWWLEDDRRLTKHARQLIKDSDDVMVSIVSIWELAIKVCQRKLEVDIANLKPSMETHGFQLLSVTIPHAVECSHLPWHHKDPFDRMLVAQSIVEGTRLLTHDDRLEAYGPIVMVV